MSLPCLVKIWLKKEYLRFLNQAWGERKGWEGLKTGKLKQLREEEGWIADALGFWYEADYIHLFFDLRYLPFNKSLKK